MTQFTEYPSFNALTEHFSRINQIHLRTHFAQNPSRCNQFSIEFNNFLFDYSKNHITQETIDLLLKFAEEIELKSLIEKMFSGEKINFTENRAVLHTALRNQSDRPVMVDGQDVMPGIKSVLDRMRTFTDKVRNGHWKGFSGKAITDIVNIGIGGSDLGPYMVTEALKPFNQDGLNIHFVSNIDGSQLTDVVEKLNQETVLFVIASKTFTTQETMTNANSAKKWLCRSMNHADIVNHFVAVSTNAEAVVEFGIDAENMFEFWDWVGGRFSLWSSIGLPIALYIGMDRFDELLDGAFQMDEHFRNVNFANNIPVIMGLLGFWYNHFFQCKSHAILPYDQHLHRFPAYLQQAEMESNGKSVNRDGQVIDYSTCPVIWGESGTNGQHAFYQLLHQGTHMIPADFILPVKPYHDLQQHHDILTANCIAQTEALMMGKTKDEVRQELESSGVDEASINHLSPHKVFKGNKPTNTILFDQLTPRNLGSLIAMYEHKITVQGCLWGINSFDQWGVELGKQLAKQVLVDIDSETMTGQHDGSTQQLIAFYKKYK